VVPGAPEDTASFKVERKGAVVAGQLWSGISASTQACARRARQVCDPDCRVQHLPVPLPRQELGPALVVLHASLGTPGLSPGPSPWLVDLHLFEQTPQMPQDPAQGKLLLACWFRLSAVSCPHPSLGEQVR